MEGPLHLFLVVSLSFPCLTVLTKTSSTIINRSGKSRYPCLIPVLRKNVLRFSPFNDVGYLELKRTEYRINQTKSWFFEKNSNKIDKPVV